MCRKQTEKTVFLKEFSSFLSLYIAMLTTFNQFIVGRVVSHHHNPLEGELSFHKCNFQWVCY